MTPSEKKFAIWFFIVTGCVLLIAVTVTLCVVLPGGNDSARQGGPDREKPLAVDSKSESEGTRSLPSGTGGPTAQALPAEGVKFEFAKRPHEFYEVYGHRILRDGCWHITNLALEPITITKATFNGQYPIEVQRTSDTLPCTLKQGDTLQALEDFAYTTSDTFIPPAGVPLGADSVPAITYRPNGKKAVTIELYTNKGKVVYSVYRRTTSVQLTPSS